MNHDIGREYTGIPTFSGPTYEISKRYENDPDLDSLFHLCNELLNMAYFAKLKYMYVCKLMKNMPDKMTLFFPTVVQSLCHALIMDTARLYDIDGLSVHDVKRKSEAILRHKGAHTDVAEAISSEICQSRNVFRDSDFKYASDSLRTVRNKIYAHNDRNCCFNYYGLLFEHHLNLQNLSDMLDVVGRMCAVILQALSDELICEWSDAYFEKATSDLSLTISLN